MATVTTLAPDPRRPGYQVVRVDRGRVASVPAAVVRPLGITEGDELAPEMLGRLEALLARERAYQAAVRALAARARARADLARRLSARGHPVDAVRSALERLARAGFLDDMRFAAAYVSRRRGSRGSARLVAELLAQGVERAVAERAVGEGSGAEGAALEFDAARALARRRAAQLGHLPFEVRRRRVLAYLARRGYRGPGIFDAVSGICAAG